MRTDYLCHPASWAAACSHGVEPRVRRARPTRYGAGGEAQSDPRLAGWLCCVALLPRSPLAFLARAFPVLLSSSCKCEIATCMIPSPAGCRPLPQYKVHSCTPDARLLFKHPPSRSHAFCIVATRHTSPLSTAVSSVTTCLLPNRPCSRGRALHCACSTRVPASADTGPARPRSTRQQQQLAGSLEGTLHTRSLESGMRERGVQQMIRGCVVLQQILGYAPSHIAMPSTLLTHMETHTAQRSNSHLVCMLCR